MGTTKVRGWVRWAVCGVALAVGAIGCGGSSKTGNDGGVLVPADPCSVNHGGCDANATCTAIAPGESACGCNAGYAGDGRTCTAIDACKLGNGGCDVNAACTSTGPGTASCACKTHFAGDGGNCTGVDACAAGNGGCDPNADCTPTGPGTVSCACTTGYAGDGGSCAAIDGCGSNHGGCDVNAACTPTGPDTVSCACNLGYAGDGGSCAAVDACAASDGGVCGPGSVCQSTGPGTFACPCDDGFSAEDGGACSPIDACAVSDGGGCAAGAACQNTGPGTSACVCITGYAGDDAGNCTAIDPCATANGGCDPLATCTNTGPGTHTCTCPAGLVGGSTCYLPGALLIDDGAKTVNTNTVTLQLQPPGNLLHNANLASGDLTNWSADIMGGNGAVVTPSGLFSGNKWRTSYAWDVRSQEVDLLAAGYTAAQLDGDSSPVFTVVDWAQGDWPNYGDEFALHAELRDADHHALVSQDDGTAVAPVILSASWAARSLSFSGYPAGARYLAIQDASKDVEFWAGQYGGAMADTYAGSPEFTVQLSNDGVTWSDPQQWSPEVDWTLGNDGSAVVLARFVDASGAIVQTLAATIGNCPGGYTWSGDSCLDDQECEDGIGRCDAHATCYDVEGSYTCACNVGFQGNGATCTAMTQCQANACDPNAACANTSASTYTCTCNSGYAGDGKTCNPVNACNTPVGTTPVCDVNADCTATGPGTFSCACKSGYVQQFGSKCVPSNPCVTANPCSANATCSNPAPGAAFCSCNPGYQGNGQTCAEINPCLQQVGYCHDGFCTHTGPGTAVCKCPVSTNLINNRCESLPQIVLGWGDHTLAHGSWPLFVMPFDNLLVDADNSNGLNGWTVTSQPNAAPVVSSTTPGLFSGRSMIGSWQWSTRSQTININTAGLTNQQFVSGATFLAQECFTGTGPVGHDDYFMQVDLIDYGGHVTSSVQAGNTATPLVTNSPWWCVSSLITTTPGTAAVRFTDGVKDEENWLGNYGTAAANAYLGLAPKYEYSIDNGASWSALTTLHTGTFINLATPGAATVKVRLSYDDGATFMPYMPSESVTVQ